LGLNHADNNKELKIKSFKQENINLEKRKKYHVHTSRGHMPIKRHSEMVKLINKSSQLRFSDF